MWGSSGWAEAHPAAQPGPLAAAAPAAAASMRHAAPPSAATAPVPPPSQPSARIPSPAPTPTPAPPAAGPLAAGAVVIAANEAALPASKAPAAAEGDDWAWGSNPFLEAPPVTEGPLAAGVAALAGPSSAAALEAANAAPQPAPAAPVEDPFAASLAFSETLILPASDSTVGQCLAEAVAGGGDTCGLPGTAAQPAAAWVNPFEDAPAAAPTSSTAEPEGWTNPSEDALAPAQLAPVPAAGGTDWALNNPFVAGAVAARPVAAGVAEALEDDDWGDFDAAPPAAVVPDSVDTAPLALRGADGGLAVPAAAEQQQGGAESCKNSAAVDALTAQMPDLSFMLAYDSVLPGPA